VDGLEKNIIRRMKMLDPKVPLATYVGSPKIRVVTPDGKRVIAWGNILPATADGAKRQEAAVCASFVKMKLQIADFMTVQEFNRVMGGNGPPRYNFHTGYYYDYGAYPDGHPSGILICTDDRVLVAKSRPPRPTKQDDKADLKAAEDAEGDASEYGMDDESAHKALPEPKAGAAGAAGAKDVGGTES
jgi:hypothetical protein